MKDQFREIMNLHKHLYFLGEKKLFIDLLNPIKYNQDKAIYSFQFLSKNQVEKFNSTIDDGNVDSFLFEVEKVRLFHDAHEIILFLINNNLSIESLPGKTLLHLYKFWRLLC